MWKRQEEYKPERVDDSKETMDFIHYGLMHNGLAENVAACTRSTQVQDRQVLVLKGRSGHRFPPLTKKLSLTDTCLQRKKKMFSPMKSH